MKIVARVAVCRLVLACSALTAVPGSAKSLFVHYMPWFQSMGRSGNWTHWGDTIPRHSSHFTPLIGLYDSRDPEVIEYQVLTMKYAGLDGLFMDWYGIHTAGPEYGTQPIFQVLERAKMRYCIVWEDRYTNNQGGPGAVLQFIEQNFFTTGNYLKIGGRPLLAVWQITFNTGEEWHNNLNAATFRTPPILITRDNALEPAAQGAYSWINAGGGTAAVMSSLYGFLFNAWPYMVPAALPRFIDHYGDFSYGTIDDQNGETFVNTLTACLESHCEIVQIATWNDWQEGTIIEPSVEYQYRDLEVIQSMRKKYIDAKFSYTAAHLRLPDRLLRERRQTRNSPQDIARLDSAAAALFDGDPELAIAILDKRVSTVQFARPVHAPQPDHTGNLEIFTLQGRRVGAPRALQDRSSNCRPGVYVFKNTDGSMKTRLMYPLAGK